jgi:hypothetical protein
METVCSFETLVVFAYKCTWYHSPKSNIDVYTAAFRTSDLISVASLVLEEVGFQEPRKKGTEIKPILKFN